MVLHRNGAAGCLVRYATTTLHVSNTAADYRTTGGDILCLRLGCLDSRMYYLLGGRCL
jgi:hypothetical protein